MWGRPAARDGDVATSCGGGATQRTVQPEHTPGRWCTGCGRRRHRGDGKTPPYEPRSQELQSSHRLACWRGRKANAVIEYNSAEFVFIHPPPASPPWQTVTENFCTPWIELRESKRLDHPSEIVLFQNTFQNTFAASFCRATPWTSVMRELPLALPLRPWGIAHSLATETPPAPQCTSQAPHRL